MSDNKIIPEGFYEGKLLDYGIRMTKSTNQPSVTAVFQVIHQVDNSVHNIYWQGTFKGRDGNSNETTLKALVVMGLSDVERVGDIAAGKPGCALDTDKTYNLKITVEWNDQTGKSHNKVAFINDIGSGGGLKDLVTAFDFKPMVAGLNISGDLKRIISQNASKAPAKNTNSVPFVDDIAF